MPRVVQRPFGFAGKLVFVLFLALVAGFFWAKSETGYTFEDVARIFSQSPKPRAYTPPRPTDTGTSNNPDSPAPRAPLAPVAPAPPPRPAMYTAERMDGLFEEVGTHLRKGRIKEANELFRRHDPSLVPDDRLMDFRKTEKDLEKYQRLLQETVHGATIDLPLMAELDLKSGGALVVKNLQEDPANVRFETLTGIKSSLKRADVSAIRRQPKEAGGVLVDEELEKQASYRGVRIAKNGIDWSFSDGQRGAVPGLAYFELADFCARNGRNTRIVPLFTEGLKRDPDLTTTVFEKKAAQFVDILLYFIAIQSKDDAQRTFDLLKRRYGLSKAYKERIDGDPEFKKVFTDLFEVEIAQAPKPGPPTPDEPPTSSEPEPTPDVPPPPPPPPPPPQGTPPAPPPPPAASDPEPTPPKPPPPPVDEDPDKVDGAQPTVLPPKSPSRAVDLVKKGDELFKQAMKHVLNSDSQKNPEGWIEENRKALALLTQAFEKCYYPAQDVFEKAKQQVPRSLLNRVRQCQMTKVMCRKRDVQAR